MRPVNVYVIVQSPAQFPRALKLFERKVRAEGIVSEAKKRLHFRKKIGRDHRPPPRRHGHSAPTS